MTTKAESIEAGNSLKIRCKFDESLTDLKYQKENEIVKTIYSKMGGSAVAFDKKWVAIDDIDQFVIFKKNKIEITDSGTYFCSDSQKRNSTFKYDIYGKLSSVTGSIMTHKL